jgi:hypothetical protein
METQTHADEITVTIAYTPIEGCTLKAVLLAREIERRFAIPVAVHERTDGRFEVAVNGDPIHIGQGPCNPQERFEPVLDALKLYKRPVREAATTLPDPDRENDPDYQAWRRALCSGE